MLVIVLKPRRNNSPLLFGPRGERKYQPVIDETGTYTFECNTAEDLALMARFPDTYLLPAAAMEPAPEPAPKPAPEPAPKSTPEPAPKSTPHTRAGKRASRLG